MPDLKPFTATAPRLDLLSADDLAEWRAAASSLDVPLPAPELICISLSRPDAIAAIDAARSAGERVLALATRAQTRARQEALRAGAEELLTTGPILAAELFARLTLLDRGHAMPAALTLENDRLTICDKVHELQERETQVMGMLVAARGGFVPHDDLLALWGENAQDRQYLRVAIAKLRRRIEPEPDMPRYLLSEPGIGYRLGNGMASAPPD